jgi:hypothetical protein
MKDFKKIVRVTNPVPVNNRPLLGDVLKSVGKLPGSSVVLGIPMDDKERPVMLDAHDPKAPNIIVWDKKARQGLNVLRVVAEYLFRFHSKFGHRAKGIEFIVLTMYAEDWGELNEYGMGMKGDTSCIGIIPFFSELAEKVIAGLAQWVAERHSHSKQPVIILVDGLENLDKMGDGFKFHIRYLMDMGRSKNVYFIGTANKKNFHQVQDWMDRFQREIYGMDVEHEFEYVEKGGSIFFYAPLTEIL